METIITHSQVQQLVMQLPSFKLEAVYNFLVALNTEKTQSAEDLMNLSLTERRRIMAQQAAQLKEHYEQTASERELWQGGEIIEY